MTDPPFAEPSPPSPEQEERWAYADGLRALANFIEDTPGAPMPLGAMKRHYGDADEYDRVVAIIGAKPNPSRSGSGYEHAERKFGPIVYGVQTDGRAMQQIKQRERAIAERERELGLSAEDIAA
jgi:hypothetical protein